MGSKQGAIRTAAKKACISEEEYRRRTEAGEKRCIRCRRWKSRDTLWRDASRWDGHASTCTDCSRVGPKQLPLIRPSQAEYERMWYATDADYRFRRQQHTMKRRGVDAMPSEGADLLLDQFKNRCAYCVVGTAETWDHIVPVTKGGQTEPGNIVPACRSCNSRKGDRDLNEFMDKAGFAYIDELESVLVVGFLGGAIDG